MVAWLVIAGIALILLLCCWIVVRGRKRYDDSDDGPAGDGPRTNPADTAAGFHV